MSQIDELFETLTQLQDSKRMPPLHLWQPEHQGKIDIRIDREGRWFHEGTPILRQPLVDLFATILRLEGNTYFLVTPVEKMAIEVEEVPFVAVDLDVRGAADEQDLLFSTNVGDYILANEDHPVFMRDERPFLMVRDNLLARIARSVFYRMVDAGFEREGQLYVSSQGTRFSLGSVT